MTESDDTRRKRGRPPKSIAHRDWFELQLSGARALAKWHEEKGNHAHARASRERVAELERERPAKWRASRPIAAYESRHPVLPWHLTGPLAERKRQSLLDAVAAVETLLRVREAGLNVEELTRKAEAACSVCEATWRGDGSGTGRKRLREALERLDAGALNSSHWPGRNTDVMRVVNYATMVGHDTIARALGIKS